MLTARNLIEQPRNMRPHVVLLGAGASRAAFPQGDANGQRLPVMDDLVNIIGLQSLIDECNLDLEGETNFEAIYSRLLTKSECTSHVEALERKIDDYFSNLALPDSATIYDRLLISLRPIDAVFTFNWDPFLFDAYARNYNAVPLPEIFFLHGNVRIGECREHDKWGGKYGWCPDCDKPFTEVKLLYPIDNKDYSKDPYIKRNWEAARRLFTEAFTITIFGYGAPHSDKDAVELLRGSWFGNSERNMEHIEIIDTACNARLHERWSRFTPTHHYQFTEDFENSRIAHWPRRSGESVFYPMTQGLPCEDFPLPNTDSIIELQAYAAGIARYEQVL